MGLKEAKDMVEKTPCILKAACKKSEAEELKEKLAAIGCTINLLWEGLESYIFFTALNL